ncbi:MAG: Ldh family oxidoreductase [Chloroflexi bacterium]|nr:Ldh family oxidoreductase [Chloroflexota bacterium]
MPVFAADELRDFTTRLLMAAGAPEDIASAVAASLVTTNLRGHDSHGVQQLMKYVGKIRDGSLVASARPTIESTRGALARVDGGWAFGQITASFGADLAADRAAEYGMAAVALRRVNHIGRAGEYAERIAAQGLIGIVLASGASAGGSVAPFGSRQRMFGTNPMAWAVPTTTGRAPLVLDFATSGIAIGKVQLARDKGERVPPGMLITHDGSPTTDPNDFYNDGVLLPFGLHKGGGLALMLEIIPTLLAGFTPASSPNYRPGNPTLILALDVAYFVDRDEFDDEVRTLLDRIRGSTPLDGVERVLLPGEPESIAALERAVTGIPVPDATWAELSALAVSLGVTV